jgi:pyruvate ferredoxin oxidoreductase alpha subunit
VIEPIEFWTKEMVQQYLPPFKPLNRLHPDKVVTMGAFGMPEIYAEHKKAHNVALLNSRPTITKAWDELAELTGRKYAPLELYKAEDAETLIVGMGTICETASIAVDQMREAGEKVGLVEIRLWRPLPADDIRKALAGADHVIVLDRAITLGGASAPVASEIRAVMYHEPNKPKIHSMIAGLGQRDVTPEDVITMLEIALGEETNDYHIYGVRG